MAYKKKYNKKKKTTAGKKKKLMVYKQSKINYPLMPETRLARVNYTTRIRINPLAVASGVGETAPNMARHTFVLNSMYNPDVTTSSTTFHSKSGAPKHQPRMYDQWSTFYEYATVVGAKVKMCWTTSQRVKTATGGSNHDGAVVAALVFEPTPCAIGYLKEEYEQNTGPSVRFDDVAEKKQLIYKKTKQEAGTYYMTKYWSLKKDPLYKTELWKSSGDGSDVSWGASFGQDISTNNKRYLHLVANPLITLDNEDPNPIDVMVEMEQIVLLSNLRDVAQSH